MDEQKEQLMKSVMIANEFLKVIHGYSNEQKRDDGFPPELAQDLANDYLNNIMEEQKIEPEMLVWGFVKIIEILLVNSNVEPRELNETLDTFIDYLKESNA